MRAIRFLGLGLVALALAATHGLTQDGGGGRRFGGGGSGGGGFSFNPNDFFNRMANGKEVWVRSEITDPRMQGMFDRMAERLGITNGQITREQFTNSMQQRMGGGGQGRMGGGPGGSPGGGSPGGGPPAAGQPGGGAGNGQEAWAGWAEGMFRRYDLNGDGYLNNDEMPEELRSEKDKWDTDHNGLIDLNEYKAYFQARMQQRMAERGGAGFGPSGDDMGTASLAIVTPEEEEKKPVVYHAGTLPKELPGWFQQLDTDKDAQIGLYEWKASGRPIKDFLEIDRNGDGFLTVEEVLAFEAKNKKGVGNGTQVASANGSATNAPTGMVAYNSGGQGAWSGANGTTPGGWGGANGSNTAGMGFRPPGGNGAMRSNGGGNGWGGNPWAGNGGGGNGSNRRRANR